VRDPQRSYRRVSDEDLLRLGQIARADREEFFQRNPRYGPLADRVVAVALCQGAGLHYVDGKTGIKDLDVWTFYAAHAQLIYPWRRPITPRDFGHPKFGRSPDHPEYVGRKVDCVGRSLRVACTADPIAALRAYLSNAKGGSPAKLAEKGVVLIEPARLRGTLVWPPVLARMR